MLRNSEEKERDNWNLNNLRKREKPTENGYSKKLGREEERERERENEIGMGIGRDET